ncbi:unnamed protein product [Dicrocoelium dendriticum]|nr:unnamed protein product [Dicrocoelium dendriticum]
MVPGYALHVPACRLVFPTCFSVPPCKHPAASPLPLVVLPPQPSSAVPDTPAPPLPPPVAAPPLAQARAPKARHASSAHATPSPQVQLPQHSPMVAHTQSAPLAPGPARSVFSPLHTPNPQDRPSAGPRHNSHSPPALKIPTSPPPQLPGLSPSLCPPNSRPTAPPSARSTPRVGAPASRPPPRSPPSEPSTRLSHPPPHLLSPQHHSVPPLRGCPAPAPRTRVHPPAPSPSKKRQLGQPPPHGSQSPPPLHTALGPPRPVPAPPPPTGCLVSPPAQAQAGLHGCVTLPLLLAPHKKRHRPRHTPNGSLHLSPVLTWVRPRILPNWFCLDPSSPQSTTTRPPLPLPSIPPARFVRVWTPPPIVISTPPPPHERVRPPHRPEVVSVRLTD